MWIRLPDGSRSLRQADRQMAGVRRLFPVCTRPAGRRVQAEPGLRRDLSVNRCYGPPGGLGLARTRPGPPQLPSNARSRQNAGVRQQRRFEKVAAHGQGLREYLPRWRSSSRQAGEATKAELLQQAKNAGIEDASSMSKDELHDALKPE
jgi:hypothetical protein